MHKCAYLLCSYVTVCVCVCALAELVAKSQLLPPSVGIGMAAN